ncbi:MAG TPA: phosphatase PAP2 family protein [Bacteroidia bacterium]|jgi:membrane-associated phospholipid phosphatase|nr:phosphatase PAP2 family protein [Bacteroidia bacterium]
MKKLANLISYLFHPIFMLTYLTAYFLFTNNYFAYFVPPVKKLFLMAAVVVFSVLLPLLNMVLLKKMGYIKDMQAHQSSERLMPYVSTLTLYIGLLYILHGLSLPYFFKQIILVSLLVIAADFIINFFTKISAHASAIGGCLGVIYFCEFFSTSANIIPLCICLGIAGLICFARLYLNEHSPKQVYAGFAVGLLTSLACLTLLLFVNFNL